MSDKVSECWKYPEITFRHVWRTGKVLCFSWNLWWNFQFAIFQVRKNIFLQNVYFSLRILIESNFEFFSWKNLLFRIEKWRNFNGMLEIHVFLYSLLVKKMDLRWFQQFIGSTLQFTYIHSNAIKNYMTNYFSLLFFKKNLLPHITVHTSQWQIFGWHFEFGRNFTFLLFFDILNLFS